MLELPGHDAAMSFSIGWLDRPEVVKHQDSPTGAALLNCLVIGWRSVEDHMDARRTSKFVEAAGDVKEKLLPPLEGMGMRHVSFQMM